MGKILNLVAHKLHYRIAKGCHERNCRVRETYKMREGGHNTADRILTMKGIAIEGITVLKVEA